ncbi:hypothetical protein M011DRAFT_398342 [Sporormia fimetaria CBS 119925]|uniref:C2H2-type domain-containing protein n=1 Tax=Sporormia fimetaria CBS 119925 TaxID=1340428 RepID=A0A6A6VFC9_9PLEO|nr:hypothetical protein M011DRAFT_398342 [Sporormia fimetaria CBS 119925]
MAASTRALTPTHSGPFSRPDSPSAVGINTAQRHANGGATFGAQLTKSPRGLSPQPLTGAAAIADERRHREQERSRQTTPNPGAAIVQSLLGTSAQPMSQPRDGPSPGQTSAPMEGAQAARELATVASDTMQTSPVSLSSFGSNDHLATAAAATAAEATAGQGLAQEGMQSQAPQPPQPHPQHIAPHPGEVPGNRALTYPGPIPPEHDPRAPSRQLSLPGYQPKSPGGKRHKCPYCSTDFTRHHNLKSHLLTHSQEKPYECPTCNSRFRRLHDLKRHTKLHTGERPHTCPKCGRRFARGDALARHNKGQGGCAGRRSSFGIDDDLGEPKPDEMDGLVYHNDADAMGEHDDDSSGRRVSEPARKRQNTGGSSQAPSMHFNANHANVFAQGGMTESPKPISPGHAEQHRLGPPDGSYPPPRSPNMSQQMHQQNLSRRAARGSSPMAMQQHGGAGPHLPPLQQQQQQQQSIQGFAQMGSKQGSQGAKGNGQAMLPQQMPPEAQMGGLSNHGAMDRQNADVMQLVRDMQSRMVRMEESHRSEMQAMQDEVNKLRAQLAQQHTTEPAAPPESL